MRALVCEGVRLSLELNYPHPTPVKGEALIRVLQMGICNTDLEMVRGYMSFLGILGHEFVGVVEEVYGDNVSVEAQQLVGKRVVGEINAACHRPTCPMCQYALFTHCPTRTTLGIQNRDGAFADYTMLPVENLHVVPDNVSDDEAVFTEPLAANFEILEQVHMTPTESVVILGDGKMGQLAAQVLALSGCELMMVGKHEEKLALAEKRGVAPYLLKDVEQTGILGGRRVDMVVECTGSTQGFSLAMKMVRPRGTILLKSTVADQSTLHLAPLVIDEIRVQGSRCGPFAPALRALSQKMLDVRPFISATYTLDDGIEAFQHAAKPGVLKVLLKA